MSNTGTLIGAAVGLSAGLFGATRMRKIDYENQGVGVPFALGCIGAIAGGLIGHNFDKTHSAYDPYDDSDIQSLKQFALYPDTEPPELQKIK